MTALTRVEGATLLPVLITRRAAALGARALLIKGQATDFHRLRRAQLSNDVDLLVEPSGFDALVTDLIDHGWLQTDDLSQPIVPAEKHSVALQHELWPLELDVHRRFPGLFAADGEVFEALWEDRVELKLGGQMVPAAGFAGSVILVVLHAWRNPGTNKSAVELEQIATILGAAEPAVRASVSLLVQRTKGSAAGPERWSELGIDPGPAVEVQPENLLAWRIQADTGRKPLALGWLFELRRQPLHRRPAVMFRALLGADEPHLRARYPDAPPGRRGLWVIRWWRLKIVVRDIPRIVGLLRRHRRR